MRRIQGLSRDMGAYQLSGDMKRVKAKGITAIVYEPNLTCNSFFGSEVVNDLDEFKSRCSIIVANRISPRLHEVSNILVTRDLFGVDA